MRHIEQVNRPSGRFIAQSEEQQQQQQQQLQQQKSVDEVDSNPFFCTKFDTQIRKPSCGSDCQQQQQQLCGSPPTIVSSCDAGGTPGQPRLEQNHGHVSNINMTWFLNLSDDEISSKKFF